MLIYKHYRINCLTMRKLGVVSLLEEVYSVVNLFIVTVYMWALCISQ